MRQFLIRIRVVLLAVTLACLPAVAQDTRVIVPDHPGGIPVNGCFRANRTMFGPYRLTFCLDRRGTYQVEGAGIRCDGSLTWGASGRDIFIDLRRGSCGRGRAWEAASVDCRHSGSLLGRLAGRLLDIPLLSTLRCTYHPSVPGVGRRDFTATRI